MASSDTIYTGYRNYSRFYLSWSVGQQDIAGNRTLINWTVGVQGQPGYTAYWYSNAIRVNSLYIDNQGNLASGTWSNITLVNGQSVPLRSGSLWVSHNADGTKAFGASLSGWFYGNGDVTTSGSWSLDTIPRNSQVSTDKAAYTLGETITINTNRKSTSFSHTVTIRKDNAGGTLLKTFNSVGDSYTWVPSSGDITTMQGLIPNSNTLTLYIESYNNQVGQSSNVTRNLTLTEANPTFTNFTFKDSNAAAVAITGSDQVLVKGQSTLETTISSGNKMTAIKSATADHYAITYDGTTQQEAYAASGSIVDMFSPIATIGQRTIVVTAFDSRGNNTSVSKQVTVYDYSAPTIESTITRENNFGNNTTVHLEGKWTPLTIGGVDKNSLTSGSLQYRYKEDGGSFGSWTAKTFTATGDEWAINTDFVVSLDNTKKYVFEFKISDAFQTVTVQGSVDVGKPILFVGENSGAPVVAIGSMPVAGAAITINGYDLLSALYPVGSIFISGSSTMPALIDSIGTWARLKGRVIVGVDEAQTEFDNVDETGGAKTHTLTTAQLPAHNHGITQASNGGGGNLTYPAFAGTNFGVNSFTENAGSGQAHNNLQPYKAKYMWERTA